jgi:hypothetical protein
MRGAAAAVATRQRAGSGGALRQRRRVTRRTLSFAFLFAPRSSSSDTTDAWPLYAAKCSGVAPFCVRPTQRARRSGGTAGPLGRECRAAVAGEAARPVAARAQRPMPRLRRGRRRGMPATTAQEGARRAVQQQRARQLTPFANERRRSRRKRAAAQSRCRAWRVVCSAAAAARAAVRCAAHLVFHLRVCSALQQQRRDGRVAVICGILQRRHANLRAPHAARAAQRRRRGRVSALTAAGQGHWCVSGTAAARTPPCDRARQSVARNADIGGGTGGGALRDARCFLAPGPLRAPAAATRRSRGRSLRQSAAAWSHSARAPRSRVRRGGGRVSAPRQRQSAATGA